MVSLTKGNRLELILVGVILVGAGIWAYFNTPQDISPNTVDLPDQQTVMAKTEGFRLESSAFANDGMIPTTYTCDGPNISPPFTISEVPAEVKSMALIMDDPDATNGTFSHWVLWDLDPAKNEFPEDAIPEKVTEGTNGAGTIGYRGPCPPAGTHRYFFKLYALDTDVGLDSQATAGAVMKAIEGHIVGEATLVGRYSR